MELFFYSPRLNRNANSYLGSPGQIQIYWARVEACNSRTHSMSHHSQCCKDWNKHPLQHCLHNHHCQWCILQKTHMISPKCWQLWRKNPIPSQIPLKAIFNRHREICSISFVLWKIMISCTIYTHVHRLRVQFFKIWQLLFWYLRCLFYVKFHWELKMTFKQIEINLGQTWQDNISPLNPSSWLLFIKIQRASCISRSWIISAANSLLSQPPSPCSAWTLSVQVEECLHFILKIFSSKGIISLNVSLLDPPELIHLHLSEMPLYSPVFYLCDRVFTLTLLLHDRDYYHQASLESIKQESPFSCHN